MNYSVFLNKPQIICLLLLLFLSSVNIFAQTEETTENENKSAESLFPEIEKNLSNNDEQEICSLSGNKCFTRKELLEIAGGKIISGNSNFGKIEAYFLLEDYNSLLTLCNKLQGGGLKYGDCTVYRGFVYLKKGKYEDAFKIFDDNLSVNSYPTANYGRGEVYLHWRKYEEALADFSRALEINHRFSKAYFSRGIIYLKRGKDLLREENYDLAEIELKNALKDFNSVIEIDLNRTTPETYRQRANVYELLGDDFHAEADRVLAKEVSEKKQTKK